MSPESYWIPQGNFRPRRYRPGGVGNWSGHLPFANDLIASLQPKLLVELGTHYGESYFGLCQAVAENGVPCVCYAVDTWKGEAHAGHYDESVYRNVSNYNAENYSSFSYLLRTTFDEASVSFSEDSIDILHIDGLHVYEAVSHDFHTWLPKVKPGGIILLHDIVGRHGDFGVWKLWEELNSVGCKFAFTHDWGLGVFLKSGNSIAESPLLKALFESKPAVQEHIRRFYALCAVKLESEYDLKGSRSQTGKALVQVYRFAGGYSADLVDRAELAVGSWQQVRVDMASGIGNGPLRLDPAEQPAVIDVASIAIRKSIDNSIVWIVERPADIAAVQTNNDLSVLDASPQKGFCRYSSWGSDPQLFIPDISQEGSDQPFRLELWVRIQTELSSMLEVVRDVLFEVTSQRDTLAGQVKTLSEMQLNELKTQLTEVMSDRDRLVTQLQEISAERDSILTARMQLTEVMSDRDRLVTQLQEISAERDSILTAQRMMQRELYITNSDLARMKTDFEQYRVSGLVAEKKITSLSQRNQELEQANNTRERDLKWLSEKKQELEEANDAFQRDIRWLSEKKHEVEERSKGFERRVISLSQRNQELEARNSECQQVINAILSSRSWRLTRPLRAFARKFKSR